MAGNEAIAFDTHRFVKNLTEHGFTVEQAEVLANEQVELLNSNLATKADIKRLHYDIEQLRLATKADIKQLRLATKKDIEQLRLATKVDIKQLHNDIEQLRLDTKSDIEQSRLATKADIAELESRLLRWMIGALIAQGGLIVALIKLI